MENDIEAMMAKALDGKFFWESTTKYDDASTGNMAEIRRAQKKFVTSPEKPKTAYIPTGSKVRLVDQRMEALENIPGELKLLRAEISKLYGVSERELEGEAPRQKLIPAPAHYIWAGLRYNPHLSIAEFGRLIGRHHSTLIHRRDSFEAVKEHYLDKIEELDRVMGYKGPFGEVKSQITCNDQSGV